MSKTRHSNAQPSAPENHAATRRHEQPPLPSERSSSSVLGMFLHWLRSFLETEAASGVVLVLSAVAALVWANVHPPSYAAAFESPIRFGPALGFSVRELISDGLMTLFFFVVGMEIKRELVAGELDSLRKATLPAVAALGGTVAPAAVFMAFNWGGAGQRGWGIPVATDIAFCVGLLSLLQKYVPRALILFVMALAIFDDIVGIVLIAIFYGTTASGVHVPWLVATGALVLALALMNRFYTPNGLAYGVFGVGLWFALHRAGIHPTLAGVLLGIMIPTRPREDAIARSAPIDELIRWLHPPVAFIVMPAFALANSGIVLEAGASSALTSPVALGVAAGLVIGKPLGVFGCTMLSVKLGLAPLPGGASRMQLWGVSVVTGIGFTVAMLIASLAYRDEPVFQDQARLGILVGSITAALIGAIIIRLAHARAQ